MPRKEWREREREEENLAVVDAVDRSLEEEGEEGRGEEGQALWKEEVVVVKGAGRARDTCCRGEGRVGAGNRQGGEEEGRIWQGVEKVERTEGGEQGG